MEAKNLADLYNLPPLEWAPVEARLDQGITMAPDTGGPNRHPCWLATINADGSPHVNGIGAMWFDGVWWVVTGEQSRKGRNLARDARCSISVGVHEFDLVVDGTAEKITDPATVAKIAEHFVDAAGPAVVRSEEHTSELQSRENLVCRLLLEKKKKKKHKHKKIKKKKT